MVSLFLLLSVPETVLREVFTLVLAASVAIVAWLQWWVALNKFRLDLFDRRYKVYDATRKFLSAIVGEATFTDRQLVEFYGETSDAGFLFDADVVDYLEQIRKRALDMRAHQKHFERLPVGDEHSRHVQANHDQVVWVK